MNYNKMVGFCKDIGLFTINRSIVNSCVHATSYCKKHCYNNVFLSWGNVQVRDIKNEIFWEILDGNMFKDIISRKKLPTDRFRLCSRGEALSKKEDVLKIEDILQVNPDIIFQLPTRSWRNYFFKNKIETSLSKHSNLRLLASIDPSNSIEEIEELDQLGYSTMFFGNNEKHPLRDKATKCIKTWSKRKGACQICPICFSEKQTHTWLKKH